MFSNFLSLHIMQTSTSTNTHTSTLARSEWFSSLSASQ